MTSGVVFANVGFHFDNPARQKMAACLVDQKRT
jgi:hypothetical protein